MQILKLLMLMLLLTALSGCGPYLSYSSVDRMATYQRHISRRMDRLFPPDSPRDALLTRYEKGEYEPPHIGHLGSFDVPLEQPFVSDIEGKIVERELPFMLDVARTMTDRPIKRVDVFIGLYGAMYLGQNGYYVFYDDQDRVLVALRSAWS